MLPLEDLDAPTWTKVATGVVFVVLPWLLYAASSAVRQRQRRRGRHREGVRAFPVSRR